MTAQSHRMATNSCQVVASADVTGSGAITFNGFLLRRWSPTRTKDAFDHLLFVQSSPFPQKTTPASGESRLPAGRRCLLAAVPDAWAMVSRQCSVRSGLTPFHVPSVL